MKPKHLVVATAVLLLSTVSGGAYASWWGDNDIKGNGHVIEHSQALNKIDEIKVALPADVHVVKGDGKLTISAEDNLQSYIKVEIDDGTLKLGSKDGYDLEPTKPIKITISTEQLAEVAVAGSGDVTVDSFSGDKDLKLKLAGSGSLTVASASYPKVSVDVAGSNDVTINGGSAEQLDISIAGSGDVDTHKLVAQHAKVSVAGSGDISVRASDSLKISIAGSGDVDYYGNPSLKQSIMGSGDINHKGD
ncbi:head GIN domain-containing protein [Gallaecimonas mangrovi]|uniref:head GIN domain-containing protein n=1 Tax=Gallaecimonas mangrovi TaxID=2291597 RepID=UPI001865EBE1|nr:head GIN domain-containing protein [Gallaecimonas mangrovi]